MAERTRGTARLARGVYLRWKWRQGIEYDGGYRPFVQWQVECHETVFLSGYRRCPLARAEEVALEQASKRLEGLLDLLQEAANGTWAAQGLKNIEARRAGR
jgi:hypothetical protein